MEIKQESYFSEKEKLFKERTGKDFTFLYKKYYPKLIYFTSKICNDRKKAEDISTDSFIVAFNKIELYDKSKAQFSTWLFTIAKNLSYQDVKKSKKSISIDVEYDNDGTTMKSFISNDEDEDESKYIVINKKAKLMKDSIYRLKEPYRTVIEMREIRKMSYKDISSDLGKNLSTIKSQIRNGRMLLIDMCENNFDKIDKMYS